MKYKVLGVGSHIGTVTVAPFYLFRFSTILIGSSIQITGGLENVRVGRSVDYDEGGVFAVAFANRAVSGVLVV